MKKSAYVYSYVRLLFLIYDFALSPSNFPSSFSCVYGFVPFLIKNHSQVLFSPSYYKVFFISQAICSLVPSSQETLKSDNKHPTRFANNHTSFLPFPCLFPVICVPVQQTKSVVSYVTLLSPRCFIPGLFVLFRCSDIAH